MKRMTLAVLPLMIAGPAAAGDEDEHGLCYETIGCVA